MFELLHTPDGVADDSVVKPPAHTAAVPDMAAGIAFTFTVAADRHPPDIQVTVAAPAETPVTIPLADPTVATAVFPLVQMPAPAESVSCTLRPAQTVLMAGVTPALLIKVLLSDAIPFTITCSAYTPAGKPSGNTIVVVSGSVPVITVPTLFQL
jgi:hypothetical protein